MAAETVRIEGLEGVLQTLKQLPPEVVSKRGGPVKFALRKAALVILKQAHDNLDTIITRENEGDLPPNSTGLLKKSTIATRGKPPKGSKGERYVVRVKNRAYPDTGGKKVTTAQVGRLLETGTEKRQPYPWIRPAYENKKHAALAEFTTQLKKKTAAVIKKLERQNAGKK